MKTKIKNKAGLTDEAIVLLLKDFICLSAIDNSLVGRTLHYILNGDDPEILAELEILDIFFKAPHFAPKLRSTETRTSLFSLKNDYCEAFLQRLGNVYHALMNPLNPNHLMPQRLKSPSWLEALLLFASSSYSGNLKTYVQLKFVEKILLSAEKGLDKMVQFIFLEDPTDFSHCKIIKTFFSLTGFTCSVVEHIHYIHEALTRDDNNIKYRALQNIQALSLPTEPLLSEIVLCSVNSLKKVRKAAMKILAKTPKKAVPFLKQILKNGRSAEKIHAVKIYHWLSPKEAEGYYAKMLKKEKNEKMINAISEVIGT